MTESYQPSSQRIALCLKACEGYSDEELSGINLRDEAKKFKSEMLGTLLSGRRLMRENEEFTSLVEDFCYLLAKKSASGGISAAMLAIYMKAIKLITTDKMEAL